MEQTVSSNLNQNLCSHLIRLGCIWWFLASLNSNDDSTWVFHYCDSFLSPSAAAQGQVRVQQQHVAAPPKLKLALNSYKCVSLRI